MGKLSRIGVAIDSDLLKRFDSLIAKRGYTNRSEAFRDLISRNPSSALAILYTVTIRLQENESLLHQREKMAALGTLAAGLAHEWIHHDYSVWFTPTYKLVDGLLRAKRDYELEHELKRLDRFQVVILDDLGYVQQSREEMEVLFTFLAERYERRSVVITSNLVFSQWDQISKDPLTTAAAIDRVVHHSRIIEFGSEITSVRAEEAARRQLQELGQETLERNER